MECVAVLLEEKSDWEYIKKTILSDANLLSKLKQIRGESITAQTKEKLKKKRNLVMKWSATRFLCRMR